MAPFCILSDHDNFINYTYVGSTWRCFVYGLVCTRDHYFWHLSLLQVPLFEPFDLGFSDLSIISCFLYNVFRISSSPLTSQIRGHLLYLKMTHVCLWPLSHDSVVCRHFHDDTSWKVTKKTPKLEDPYIEFCNSIWPHPCTVGNIFMLAKTLLQTPKSKNSHKYP